MGSPHPRPKPKPGWAGIVQVQDQPHSLDPFCISVFVFAVVALRDRNVVSCFYPKPSHQTHEVLDILPVGIGLIYSLLFVVFPTRRNRIGYLLMVHE